MHHETRKVAELNTLKLFNSMLILQEMLALYFLARSLFARDFTMADAGSLPVGLKTKSTKIYEIQCLLIKIGTIALDGSLVPTYIFQCVLVSRLFSLYIGFAEILPAKRFYVEKTTRP